MNNEPVAWTDKRQLSRPYPHSDAMTMWANSYPEQGINIPLYTTPQIKELSNEEITGQYDRGFDAGCKHAEKNLQAEIGCYKIELELHKAMIQDLEKALKKASEK